MENNIKSNATPAIMAFIREQQKDIILIVPSFMHHWIEKIKLLSDIKWSPKLGYWLLPYSEIQIDKIQAIFDSIFIIDFRKNNAIGSHSSDNSKQRL